MLKKNQKKSKKNQVILWESGGNLSQVSLISYEMTLLYELTKKAAGVIRTQITDTNILTNLQTQEDKHRRRNFI